MTVVGSPNVDEIELNGLVVQNWSNIMKWLKKLNLLPSDGIGGVAHEA